MASTDAKPVPQKNVAYRVTFPIMDADGDLVTGASGLDSEVSKDGGTFADCTNEATEIATSSGVYYLDLTSTEMNADTVAIIVKTSSSGAKTTTLVMYPEEAGDIRVNVTAFGGTAGTFASGRPEVNTTHAAGTAWGSGAITAASIASDAITAAKVAADVSAEIADAVWDEDATGHQTTGTFGQAIGDPAANTATIYAAVVTNAAGTDIAADIIAVQADTDNIQTRIPAALVSGRIDASIGAMAANTLTASALATDAVTEIADQVWEEALADHSGTVGSVAEALSAAGSAGDPWSTALPGAYGAGTAGKIIGDNINATISSRASQTSLDTVDDLLDTEVAAILADTNELQTDWANGGRLDLLIDAIKAKTDSLAFTVAGQVDANIQYVNDVQVTGDGQTGTEWGPA